MRFSLRRLVGAGEGAAPATGVALPERQLDEPAARQLIQFMSELGAAMNGAGDPTTLVRRSLRRMARAYGMGNLTVFALPTLLLIRFANERTSVIDLSSPTSSDLRLDQSTELHHLVNEAERGEVSAADGLRRLRTILASRARLHFAVRAAGAGLSAAGISLVLDPTAEEVAVSGLLGVLVGVIEQGGSQRPQIWPLVPAAAGFIVGAIAFGLIDLGLEARPIRLVVAPLAIFLPGAALTVSMIELANGDIVAGSSRLAYGFVRLVLLTFGVVVAAQWIGVSSPALDPSLPLGAAVPVLGVVIFTIGVSLHYSATRAAFGWILAVVLAAFAGEAFGSLFFAGQLSGLFGGAVMILVAQAVQAHPAAPPLIASVTPAFWFLVPGAAGFEGFTELAQEDAVAGLDDLLSMLLTMIAIALGVLLGLLVSGSTHAKELR